MTDAEWDAVCFFIENAWTGDFDEDKRAAYRFFLDSYDPETVTAALHVLVRNGKPFLPAAPEIVAAISVAMTPPVPAFAEAWQTIRSIMSVATRKMPRRVGIANAMAWGERHAHPVVLAFVETEGLGRLLMIEFYDPDYGPLRLRELEVRWNDFCRVAGERRERGLALASAGRRQIGPRHFGVEALRDTVRPELGAGAE